MLSLIWISNTVGRPRYDTSLRTRTRTGRSWVEANKYKHEHEHGDKCDHWAGEGDQWFVKFKKGARILVPKAVTFSRLVAGQTLTG